MKISVIVPLYNARSFVAEAIDSILSQTRPPDEVLVVDDGSTDGGSAVVAAYGPPVRLVAQANAGSAAALNMALRQVTGEAVAFLDADDLWTAEKLERQAAILLLDEKLDGVLGHVQQFRTPASGQGVGDLSAPQPGISRITLLVRRGVFERFGMFDATLSTADFVPWYSRAAALGIKTIVMPDVVAYRRLHNTNTGILRRNAQQQENLLGLKRALDLRRELGVAKKPRP